ncbi:hypothetical protein [Streptomyces sp. NRRL F-5053]|uniref:hypothetical protein n=1 Tax=Streptomyces sp. NRRL F-5053 TaxID=1463854 RepID=UPI0013318468|nr:hypothetical protein [Streptomyces sp. NRRL F-5053]
MTNFDEEWAGLKRDASSRMRLAGAPAAGWPSKAGGSDGVKSSKNAWSAAGEGISGLRSGIRKALKDLETGQQGTGAKGTVGGLECAAAQRELHASWEVYVEAVNRRCGELAEKLEKAGNHHYKNDAETEEAFRHTRTKVESPDGHGGKGGNGPHGKGR